MRGPAIQIAHNRPTVSRKMCGKGGVVGDLVNTCLHKQAGHLMCPEATPVKATPVWRPDSSRIEKMPKMGLPRGALTVGCEIGRHSRRS